MSSQDCALRAPPPRTRQPMRGQNEILMNLAQLYARVALGTSHLETELCSQGKNVEKKTLNEA